MLEEETSGCVGLWGEEKDGNNYCHTKDVPPDRDVVDQSKKMVTVKVNQGNENHYDKEDRELLLDVIPTKRVRPALDVEADELINVES